MAVATVSYTAELSNLRKALSSIAPITAEEAQKAVRVLNKSIRDAEKAQKRVIASAKKSGDAVQKSSASAAVGVRAIAIQLPDVASQMATGANPLTILTQQGLQVVQQLGMVKGALAAIAVPVGVTAAAVAVLGTAYMAITADMKRAAAVAETLEFAYDRQTVVARKLEVAQLDLAVATGETTSAQAAQMKIAFATRDAVEQNAKAYADEREEIEESIKWSKRLLSLNKIGMFGFVAVGDAVFGWTENIEAANQQLQILGNSEAQEAETLGLVREAQQAAVTATEERTRATSRGSSVDREAAIAAREQASAVAELASIRDAASLSVLGPEERLTEEYRRQQAEIIRLAEVSGDTVAAQEAAVALQTEYAIGLHDLKMAQLDTETRKLEAIDQGMIKRSEERLARERRVNSQILSSSSALTSELEGMFGALGDAQTRAGSKGARALFALQVSAAQASIIASGAEGYARAAALLPPASFLQAGAVTAGIIAAEATLATAVAPSFGDTPGPLRAGPGGMSAQFAPGDMLVAGRDESDINRQMGNAGSQVIVMDTYKHLGRYGARDALRAPGAYEQVRRQARRTVGRR